MNIAEIRDKSIDELQQQLLVLLKHQFNLRMQKASGQLFQSHLLTQARRDIARIKTVMNEKVGN